MNSVRLYERHTTPELVAMAQALRDDPANRAQGLYLYTPQTRRKLDAIAQAIAWHSADKRAAAGEPVNTEGYSGRQCNR
jgi:hypothetical protein